MVTPPSIVKMIDWQESHLSSLEYSETDPRRTSSVMTDPTDCSGLCSRLYRVEAGLNIGDFTGNEDDHGWLITTSRTLAAEGHAMLPGDLVFYRWENRQLESDPWDHVNFYAGGDLVFNHGGPRNGPVKQSLHANVDAAVAVMVRRYIEPAAPPPVVKPKPQPAPPSDLDFLEWIMSLPGAPAKLTYGQLLTDIAHAVLNYEIGVGGTVESIPQRLVDLKADVDAIKVKVQA